ncbi:MAG: glycine/sarcosine/betaine reductase component B subunit [Candidatus Binatia bacterium]
MQLTLAVHPITDIQFGTGLSLDGSALTVDGEELRRLVLEDAAIDSVAFDIVRPGESCRAGPIFDVVEPRAKADGGSDFPGIIGAPTTAGMGTTHVLAGAAVSVLAEMSPDPSRSATGRVLEMSGSATAGSAYSKLCHLLVVPQTKPGLPRSTVLKAYRVASVKVAVHLARAALAQAPASAQTFEPIGAQDKSREGLSRVVYIGQIFSRQRKPAVDEPIIYGTNTDGMLPVILHPDEWLDGALVPSLNSWFGGTETYFYQNHPVVLDLYRRHHEREINFVGTVATVAGNDNVDRVRQCHAAANLAKWNLRADGAVMTKYGGGLPHADLSETARLLEHMGIKTAVMVSDVARDRRVESALLFNVPEVNAIVYNGGNGTEYEIPKAARVIAAKPELAALLAGPMTIDANNIIGVTNQQGASRMRSLVY